MTHATLCFLSYERPAFLEEAVGTALATVGEPVEIIVHDDGSRDEKVNDLLNALVAEGSVSTVIRNADGHNEGVGRAINRCLALATGDPIIKLDQDLIFRPGWLGKVRGILDADRSVGMLGLFHYWHDPVDHHKMVIPWATNQWARTDTCVPYHYVTDFVGSAMVLRRSVWEELGPLEEHSAAFAEDLAYKTRLRDSGYQLALADEDLVTNRGFGIGPSTVAIAGPDGLPTASKINERPYLVDGVNK